MAAGRAHDSPAGSSAAVMRVLAAALVLGVASPAAQEVRFRARTEMVRIDALVEDGGRPVAGLRAEDFLVEDAGVEQKIELVTATDALFLSTVVDVSGSITEAQLQSAAAAITGLGAALHERDRHSVYAFSGATRQIDSPRQRSSGSLDDVARALRSSGGSHTALFDALYLAIIRGDDGDGPKLVVVVTDGQNNISWMDAESVISAALRHDTVVYVVAMRSATPQYAVDVPPAAAEAGLQLVQFIARRTGGRVLAADWSEKLGRAIQRILDEYRQRYILSFTPTGVSEDAWHPLTVRLRHRHGRVLAREGYWRR